MSGIGTQIGFIAPGAPKVDKFSVKFYVARVKFYSRNENGFKI